MKKKISGKKKIIISLIAIGSILMCLGGIYVFNFYQEVNYWHKMVLGIEDLPRREARFAQAPTFRDCFYLADKYGFALKNYKKGIMYAKRCFTLERPADRVDWLINFWLANLYNKSGDFSKAQSHLKSALEMDQEGRIEELGWIESSELEKIYQKILLDVKNPCTAKP